MDSTSGLCVPRGESVGLAGHLWTGAFRDGGLGIVTEIDPTWAFRARFPAFLRRSGPFRSCQTVTVRSTISTATDEIFDRLVAIRRDLHAHPEVGRAEHRTTAMIVAVLQEAGLDSDRSRSAPARTATSCRTAYDAAGWSGFGPTSTRCRSPTARTSATAPDTPGCLPRLRPRRAHHDRARRRAGAGPAARARACSRRGVRLIFQPAEETSPGGALDAIDGGVLRGPDARSTRCTATRGPMSASSRFKAGAITSAVDKVQVTLTGPGGHTSRPHLTARPHRRARRAGHHRPSCVLSRRVDPRSGVSLMWGRIARRLGGQRHPGSRADRGHAARAGRRRLAAGQRAAARAGWPRSCAPFGVERRGRRSPTGVPPAVNHAVGVDRLTARPPSDARRRTASPATEQSLGGEDFAWMLQQVPGRAGPARRPAARSQTVRRTSTSRPSTSTRRCIGDRCQGAGRAGRRRSIADSAP